MSIAPLAMPLLAGPGAIGCVALGALVALVLRLGEQVLERLGPAGIGALTKIFGFLVLAIAVELIAHGTVALRPGLR